MAVHRGVILSPTLKFVLNSIDGHLMKKGVVSLKSSAQGVLGNLPSYEQRDYLSLCKALEQRFATSNQTDLYRTQLRERKQKALETIPELGSVSYTHLTLPTICSV